MIKVGLEVAMKRCLSNYVKNTIFVTSVLVTLVSVGATLTTAALAVPYPPSAPVPESTNSSSLNGAWRVRWQVNGYSMRGRLYMQGDQGTLRIRVTGPDGTTKRVEETMFLRQRSDGFALRGSNPVYEGTNTPVPDYLPDNFRVRRSSDGWAMRTCDASGTCALGTMQYLGADLVYPRNDAGF